MSGGYVQIAPIPLNPKPITWKETPSTHERRLRPKRASPAQHETDYMEGNTFYS